MDNHTSHWTLGLKLVQLMKNSVYHSGIKMSPLFGIPARVGLSSISLPKQIIETLSSEEDLNQALASVNR